MNEKAFRTFAVAAVAAALAGCNLTGATAPPDAFPAGVAPKDAFVSTAPAGVNVPQSADGARLTKLVATRDAGGAFGMARSDPFALTTPERYFETQQQTERFFGENGFSVQLTPKPNVDDEVTPPEEQPYRRLSGIVVGDSVLAILDEGGQSTIITPGMQIPNSPWRVVSIDQDKAVLHRAGKIKPTEIIVRLETPRYGEPTSGQGSTGGPQGGGYPGGPGGPPGAPRGYPGGPGGKGGGSGFPGGGRGGD